MAFTTKNTNRKAKTNPSNFEKSITISFLEVCCFLIIFINFGIITKTTKDALIRLKKFVISLVP